MDSWSTEQALVIAFRKYRTLCGLQLQGIGDFQTSKGNMIVGGPGEWVGDELNGCLLGLGGKVSVTAFRKYMTLCGSNPLLRSSDINTADTMQWIWRTPPPP